jgi:hypothetical protein
LGELEVVLESIYLGLRLHALPGEGENLHLTR